MAALAREQAVRTLPERAVDVARVALALVELGHEADRRALLVGDLLRRVLVDHVVVGHREGVAVAEVDLVLAEVALALRVLDADAGGRHVQRIGADHVLDHRRCRGSSSRRCTRSPGGGRGSLVARRLVALAGTAGTRARSRPWPSSRARRAGRAGASGTGAATPRPACRRATRGRRARAPCPRARACGGGSRGPGGRRSRRSRAPSSTSRSPAACSCRRRPRAGSCSPPPRARRCRGGTRRRRAASPQAALHVAERHDHGVELGRGHRRAQLVERQPSVHSHLSPMLRAVASIRSSSASEPWLIGPLNQRFAEMIHQPPNRMKAPPTVSGA